MYNNIFTIIMAVKVLSLPIFIMGFYGGHANYLCDDDFKARYGVVYDGLKIGHLQNTWEGPELDATREKRFIALFHPFWFVMRRLVFALLVVVAESQLWLQIVVAFAFALAHGAYLAAYKPLTNDRMLKLELMNEGTHFILLYHVMLFAGMVPAPSARFDLGYSFIFFLCVNLLVHVVFIVIETVHMLRVFFRRKCFKKVATEDGLVEEETRIK